MKIALIGYGKMGKAIERIALQKNNEIVLKISTANLFELNAENLNKADVAIEFTGPQTAVQNIKKCFDAGVPVVCGSTGWLQHYEEVKSYCIKKNTALLYASNFSIGMNLFFKLNNCLAELMSKFTGYDVSLEEIHHAQKKDSPSGTAITLAEQIINHSSTKKSWVNNISEQKENLEIISHRVNEVPGTHKIKYHSLNDDIEIMHTAHNRNGFAAGALLAAHFIKGRRGIFTMKDAMESL